MEERTENEMLPEQPQAGMPVDLTKEEFINYHIALAKTFGSLRMQKPVMIFFGLYLAVIAVLLFTTFAQTNVWDWEMIAMLLMTVISAVLVMTITPHRVRQNAKKLYDAGDINGYYGELVITPQEITKVLGDETVSIPLNEKTVYIEDSGFMAFFTVGGQKAIILPVRCMTLDAAKRVREAVFAGGCRVSKRVIKRMQATTTDPIERRDLLRTPQTLYSVHVHYTQDEIKKQLTDMHWRQYVQSLPTILLLGVVTGALFGLLEESISAFFAATLAVILGMLILSLLGARTKTKQVTASEQQMRVFVELTDRGIHVHSGVSAHPSFMRWKSVDIAVERPDCVEFCGANQWIRIPKRCIDDMDELRTVVDSYHQPKHRK